MTTMQELPALSSVPTVPTAARLYSERAGMAGLLLGTRRCTVRGGPGRGPVMAVGGFTGSDLLPYA